MYVYGKNVAKILLANNKKINKVYLYDNFKDKDIILELKKRNIKPIFKSKRELIKLVKGNNQGIILDIPDYHFCSLTKLLNNIKELALIVILDHLEDVRNLGSIIRTCEAAGVDGIIIPKDRSVTINSVVMKVSSGALDNVLICQVTNINQIIKELKDKGIWIIGADKKGDVSYLKVDYKVPLALVIGNEGKGIKDLTKRLCDFTISIPMKGKINSLNASVAAGVIIYKIIETRK